MTSAGSILPDASSLGNAAVFIQSSAGYGDQNRLLMDAFSIVRSNDSEESIRAKLRGLLLGCDGVLGVANAKFSDSYWEIDKSEFSGSNVFCNANEVSPSRLAVVSDKLKDTFSSAFQRNAILQVRYAVEGIEAAIFAVPIAVVGAEPEVLAVAASSVRNEISLRRSLESVATAIQFWKQNSVSRSNDWKIASLSAVIDLTDRIESTGCFQKSCNLLVNEFSQYVDCSTVALGWIKKKNLQVVAITNSTKKYGASPTASRIQETLQETVLRGTPGVWAVDEEREDKALLLLHKSLGHFLQVECIRSWPIRGLDGEIVGAWLFADTKKKLLNDRLERFVEVATPRIGSALRLVLSNDAGFIRRISQTNLAKFVTSRSLLMFAGVFLFAVVLGIPLPYQVKATVEVVPEWRRFVVAPFDGQIESAFVRVGDYVQEEMVIARMDGRQLEWQLLSIRADKEKALRKREVELASRNAAEAMLAEQEIKRIEADESSLEERLERLNIKADIAGVILSGTSQRAEASSVGIGQPVFEIGATNPIRMEIAIPAEDIPTLNGNANVRIWLQGLEGQMIRVELERIRPVSEERLAKNVFIAEVTLDNSDALLRPGMIGVAKIECASSPIGWNLFHKPFNYLRTLMTW